MGCQVWHSEWLSVCCGHGRVGTGGSVTTGSVLCCCGVPAEYCVCVWLFYIHMYVHAYTVCTYTLCVRTYDCCKWRKSESIPLNLLQKTYAHTHVCFLEHDYDVLHLQQSHTSLRFTTAHMCLHALMVC